MPDNQGGNFLTRTAIDHIPNWVLMLGALAALYWYYSTHSASTSSTSSATPNNTTAPSIFFLPEGAYNVYPKAGKGQKKASRQSQSREIKVDRDETLGELAKSRHWSQSTIAEVEQMNVTQGSGKWTLDTKLKAGQIVLRPLRG